MLIDTAEGVGVVVDPGGEVERIAAHIPDELTHVSSIILTHAHIDHGGGVEKMLAHCKERFSRTPELIAYEQDQGLRSTLKGQAAAYGFSSEEYQNVPTPDLFVEEGDTVSVGSYSAQVFFTPGHSPDHISLFFQASDAHVSWFGEGDSVVSDDKVRSPLLLAGDTLFAGSIGRSDLPGGDHELLIASITNKLLTLPDETRVMPGHGPDTTIGQEKKTNPFVGTGVSTSGGVD